MASALKALNGREQKVVQGGWTFTKKRFDFEINASRASFKLIRAVQVFEQKRSFNQITATLVGHLVEEFKEFKRSDSDIKLPWCLLPMGAQAELLAQKTMSKQ